MLAVNYTNFRENMKDYMDKATNDYETMIVTRKNNVYVMGNKSNYDWLMESKEQLESGKFKEHDLIEVKDE